MSLFQKFFLSSVDATNSQVAVLTALLVQLPREPLAHVQARLAPLVAAAAGEPQTITIEVESDWQVSDHLLASFVFGAHRVEVAALAGPVPGEVLSRTVDVSPWSGGFYKHCRQQGAHIMLRYAGAHADGIEQFLALYQSLAALIPSAETEPVLAVLNEPAYTAHPGEWLRELTRLDRVGAIRESPPLPFWTSVLRWEADGELLFVSRGFPRLGVPDLAVMEMPAEKARQAHELLHDLFHYIRFENPDVQPGDFLTLAEQGYFAFADGSELNDAIGAHGRLLLVRPSSLEEIESLSE